MSEQALNQTWQKDYDHVYSLLKAAQDHITALESRVARAEVENHALREALFAAAKVYDIRLPHAPLAAAVARVVECAEQLFDNGGPGTFALDAAILTLRAARGERKEGAK